MASDDNLPRCQCGSPGYIDYRVGQRFYVGCSGADCSAETPDFSTKQKAAECWTRMVQAESTARELLAALDGKDASLVPLNNDEHVGRWLLGIGDDGDMEAFDTDDALLAWLGLGGKASGE